MGNELRFAAGSARKVAGGGDGTAGTVNVDAGCGQGLVGFAQKQPFGLLRRGFGGLSLFGGFDRCIAGDAAGNADAAAGGPDVDSLTGFDIAGYGNLAGGSDQVHVASAGGVQVTLDAKVTAGAGLEGGAGYRLGVAVDGNGACFAVNGGCGAGGKVVCHQRRTDGDGALLRLEAGSRAALNISGKGQIAFCFAGYGEAGAGGNGARLGDTILGGEADGAAGSRNSLIVGDAGGGSDAQIPACRQGALCVDIAAGVVDDHILDSVSVAGDGEVAGLFVIGVVVDIYVGTGGALCEIHRHIFVVLVFYVYVLGLVRIGNINRIQSVDAAVFCFALHIARHVDTGCGHQIHGVGQNAMVAGLGNNAAGVQVDTARIR